MTYTAEYDGQLARILAAVRGVPDVGRVHDRPRQGDFETMWTTKIDGVQQIRSWEISVGPERVERVQQNHRHRYRMWEIRGVVGLTDLAPDGDDLDTPADDYADASFHVLHRLAGEITDALEATRSAGVTAGDWIDLLDPPQKDIPTVVEIGGGAIAWGITLNVEAYTIVSP